jgi:hypothetical protein
MEVPQRANEGEVDEWHQYEWANQAYHDEEPIRNTLLFGKAMEMLKL